MAAPIINVYLDTRRKKKEQCYPVKLRVYFNYETRLYQLNLNVTQEDFSRSYLSPRPKGDYFRTLKQKIVAIESKANQTANDLDNFSFRKFELKLFRPDGAGKDVFYHYDKTVETLKNEGRHTTASNYHLSARSLRRFIESHKRSRQQLAFDDVTVTFLNQYEKWMLDSGKQITTVGIYLRPLRAIFNSAIEDGEISKDLYPFGKRRYQIPAGQNIKKALDKQTLKLLFQCDVSKNEFWEKARDFWFFSYVCNGMNIKDIVELKFKNLSGETINFIRSKTKNTTKANQKPIIVPLNSFAKSVIEKYGNKRVTNETYLFPVLNAEMGDEEKVRAVQAFTRFINQHIKILAKHLGINTDISTYWARHSFTTISIQNGASLEFIQDSLGHNNIATTMKYWKGFELNVKKELSDKLIDF